MRTADLDEALDAVGEVFLPHQVDVLGRASELDTQLNVLRLGNLTAGYLRYGPEIRMLTVEASNYSRRPASGVRSTSLGRGAQRNWGRPLLCVAMAPAVDGATAKADAMPAASSANCTGDGSR